MKLEQDLSKVFYDMQTIRMELEECSDASLFDSCAFDIDKYKRTDLEKFYDKLIMGEKLTKEERRELESFYTLANVSFFVRDDNEV